MKRSEIQPGKLYETNTGSIIEGWPDGFMETERGGFVIVREVQSGRDIRVHPRRIVRELSKREAEAYRKGGKP